MNRSINSFEHGKSSIVFVIVAAVAIGIGLLTQIRTNQPAALPTFEKLVILPNPKPLGNVSFTDHNGLPFGDDRLHNKWTILFFAFTNCPDICPSTLHTLKQVKTELAEESLWDNFQVAMVTVDPKRDTLERLKSYVPFFDKEFLGLRGKYDYTTEFAKNVGILFFKAKEYDNGGYDIDHGAALIFVNPQGEFAGVFNAPHPQDVLTRDLRKLALYAAETNTGKTPPANQPVETSTIASSATSKTSTLSTEVAIQKAWIRLPPPGAPSMAGYFSIENTSKTDIKIVGAESALFANVMIHQTSMSDGLMSMDHVESISLAAGKRLNFEPMGMHLMLMQPTQSLTVGSRVPIKLLLASGETIDTELTILADAPK